MASKSTGRDTRGRFVEGSQAAREAGRKGGKKAQAQGTAHRLTSREKSKGGSNSHSSRDE